jgi:hypothetical protein
MDLSNAALCNRDLANAVLHEQTGNISRVASRYNDFAATGRNDGPASARADEPVEIA